MKTLVQALMLIATVTFALPSSAQVCRDRVPGAVQAVDAATDDLNADRHVEAISKLYDRFGPAINGWAVNPTTATSLQREVVLIVALSTLRVDGRLRRDWQANAVLSPDLARANLDWAIRAMEGLAFVGEASDRHLAEAWARDPELATAARDKLQKLANEDKLLSPHQFEALARLHAKFGDERRSTWARRRADEKRLD